MCKEYVSMLNATHYTESPACSRVILKEFGFFENIEWKEITDKNKMETIYKERMDILSALNPTTPKGVYSTAKTFKSIQENKLKFYFYHKDVDGDGVSETIFKKHPIESVSENKKYGICEFTDNYYVQDSKITLKNAGDIRLDPYKAFNIGSGEPFVYGGGIYIGIWNGDVIQSGSNLDVYSIGNKKLCGILAK